MKTKFDLSGKEQALLKEVIINVQQGINTRKRLWARHTECSQEQIDAIVSLAISLRLLFEVNGILTWTKVSVMQALLREIPPIVVKTSFEALKDADEEADEIETVSKAIPRVLKPKPVLVNYLPELRYKEPIPTRKVIGEGKPIPRLVTLEIWPHIEALSNVTEQFHANEVINRLVDEGFGGRYLQAQVEDALVKLTHKIKPTGKSHLKRLGRDSFWFTRPPVGHRPKQTPVEARQNKFKTRKDQGLPRSTYSSRVMEWARVKKGFTFQEAFAAYAQFGYKEPPLPVVLSSLLSLLNQKRTLPKVKRVGKGKFIYVETEDQLEGETYKLQYLEEAVQKTTEWLRRLGKFVPLSFFVKYRTHLGWPEDITENSIRNLMYADFKTRPFPKLQIKDGHLFYSESSSFKGNIKDLIPSGHKVGGLRKRIQTYKRKLEMMEAELLALTSPSKWVASLDEVGCSIGEFCSGS